MVDRSRTMITSENILRELVFIIFYRKRVVLATAGTVFALALLAAVLLPPIYVSSAKYAISLSQQLDPLKKEPVYDIKNQMLRVLQSQKEIALSSTVLQQAVRQAYPDTNDENLPQRIEALRKQITVTPPKGEDFEGSNIFYLNVEADTAKGAHDLANSLSEAYRDAYAAMGKSRSTYSYDFYNAQVEKLYAAMDAKGRSLREFEIKHASRLLDILNMEVGAGRTTVEIGPKALLTESLRNRQRLTEQRQALTKIIDVLEAEAAKNTIPVVMADMEGAGKALTAYRNKVTQLQLQISELRTQFTGSYEPLQQMEKELRQTTGLLREEFGAIIKARKIEVQSLDAQIKEINDVIGQLENTLTATAQERSTYDALKQDYVLARDAYSDARSKMEQARLAVSLNQEKQDITLVQAPEEPMRPAKPNRLLLVALGIFAGVFLGLATALTLDYFDHTLKTPEEIERYLRLPCLGSVSRQST